MKKIRIYWRYIIKVFSILITKGYYKVKTPEDASDLTYETDTVVVSDHKVIEEKIKEGTISRKDNWKIFVILDAGHGPTTSGKRSPVMENNKVFYEWKFNLEIINRISYKLKSLGIPHDIVNKYLDPDHGNALKERAFVINNLITPPKNLFPLVVSQHANAWGTNWNSASGSEVWVYYNGDKDSKAHKDRVDLASVFLKHYIKNLKLRNRGVKYRLIDQFYLLRKTKYLTIFLEPGFMTNKKEVKFLDSEKGKELVVQSFVDAIIEINNKIKT